MFIMSAPGLRTRPIFFFLNECSYTHRYIYIISVKTSMVTIHEVWSPESQRHAHHLCGPSKMFFRIVAKQVWLCYPRVNSLALLPWKVEAKERVRLVQSSTTYSRPMLLTWTPAWIEAMFAVWVQTWALSHNSSLGSSSTRTPFERPLSPPSPCSNQLPKIGFIVIPW